jgi:hypothetical protein
LLRSIDKDRIERNFYTITRDDFITYIGKELQTMGDNETMREFKIIVRRKFENIFGEDFMEKHDLSIITTGWYDG